MKTLYLSEWLDDTGSLLAGRTFTGFLEAIESCKGPGGYVEFTEQVNTAQGSIVLAHDFEERMASLEGPGLFNKLDQPPKKHNDVLSPAQRSALRAMLMKMLKDMMARTGSPSAKMTLTGRKGKQMMMTMKPGGKMMMSSVSDDGTIGPEVEDEDAQDALLDEAGIMMQDIKAEPGVSMRKKKKKKKMDDDDEDGNTLSDALRRKGLEKFEREELPEGVLARYRWDEAQSEDKINRNGRVYVSEFMPKAVAEADSLAKNGQLFILKGHPAPGVPPNWDDVIGLGRRVERDESTGKVALEADILANTSGHRLVKSVLAGASVPISSRARSKFKVVSSYEGRFGRIGPSAEELDTATKQGQPIKPIVLMQEYGFRGWDLVPGIQSVHGAVRPPNGLATSAQPRPTGESTESHQDNSPEQELPMNLKELKEKHPALYASLMAEASEAFTTESNDSQEQTNARVVLLEAEKTGLQNQVKIHEAKINELTAQLPKPEPPKDPALVAALEQVAAQERTIAEINAKAHYGEICAHIEQKIDTSPFKAWGSVFRKLLVDAQERTCPDTVEACNNDFAGVEGLIYEILKIQRTNRIDPTTAVGFGVPAEQKEQLADDQLSIEIGDFDDSAETGLSRGMRMY